MKFQSPPYLEFGNVVNRGRLSAGLQNQSDLAALLSVKQQTISRWEAGTHRPRASQVSALAQAIRLDPGALMGLAGYAVGPVASFVKPFPLEFLDPQTFEHFTAYLVEMLYEGAHVQRLGDVGHDQDGLDVVARLPDGRTMGFQCKRMTQFGPAEALKAIEAKTVEVDSAVLVLSRVASPQTADVVASHPGWMIWDRDYVSRLIRQKLTVDQQIRLVDIFFNGRRQELIGVDESGPWLTAEDFFAPFMRGDRPFTHSWDLVAREAELKALVDFAGGDDTVLLVSAAGGMGKTRLLKAWSDGQVPGAAGKLVRFLAPTAVIDRKSLEHLGKTPKILVVDDAHDRDSVGVLAQYAADPKNRTQLILASRPYALARLRGDLASVNITSPVVLELPALPKADLERIARQALGMVSRENQRDMSKAIVELSAHSPLVVVLAGRVAAREPIRLEAIRDEADFRNTIVGRFSRVIVGDIGLPGSERRYRQVMEMLALVQPFHIDDTRIHQFVADVTGLPVAEVVAVLRVLDDGGVIFHRGSSYRLMPDVLGDYLIDDCCLDSAGNLSSTALSAFEKVPANLLSNMLENLGRLDWRRRDGDTEGSMLLSRIWHSFDAVDQEWDPRFDAIKAVAIYQPAQALNFVRRLIQRNRFTSVLPDILIKIAYSGRFLPDVLECLWHLARIEKRLKPGDHAHPVRVMTRLAEFDVRKPLFFSEQVLEFGLKLCDDPEAWTQTSTPLDLLQPLMSVEGLHHETIGYAFTMAPFLVPYTLVSHYRKTVLDKVFELMTSPVARVAFRAAKFIEIALRRPMGMMNTNWPQNELAPYDKEYVRTLRRAGALLLDGVSAFTALHIGYQVAWLARHGRSGLQPAAREVLDRMPETLEFRILEAIAGDVRNDFYDDDEANDVPYGTRFRNWVEDRSRLLAEAIIDTRELLAALEAGMGQFVAAGADYRAHAIVSGLCRKDVVFTFAMCDLIVAEPTSLLKEFAGLALVHAFEHDAGRAERVRTAYLRQQRTGLTVSVLNTLAYKDAALSGRDLAIVTGLLGAADEKIVLAAVNVVASCKGLSAKEKADLLLTANLQGNANIADHLAGAFFDHGSCIDLSGLDASNVWRLLEKVQHLPELSGHWLDRLLAEFSEFFPFETLKFFMNRVEYVVAGEGRLRVANYGPWQHARLRFTESPHGAALSKHYWTWLSRNAGSRAFAYEASYMFGAILGHDSDAIALFLSEHLDAASADDLALISRLLNQAHHSFVFDQLDFVTRYLQRCRDMDFDLYEKAWNDLGSAATSGMRTGQPGKPMPRDVRDLERSAEILSRISRLSPVYDLFDYVRRHSEWSIARYREDDEAFEE